MSHITRDAWLESNQERYGKQRQQPITFYFNRAIRSHNRVLKQLTDTEFSVVFEHDSPQVVEMSFITFYDYLICHSLCDMCIFIFNCRQLYRLDKVDLTVTTSEIETESEAWLLFSDPCKWVLQSYGRCVYRFRVLIVWIGAAHIPIELALLPWEQHEIEASVGQSQEVLVCHFMEEGHGVNSAFKCIHYYNLTQSCSPCILLQVVVFS